MQDRETYLALNAAANAHGLKLVGHATGIPPDVVLDAGQDGVEHTFYPSLEGMTREQQIAVWRRFADRGVPIADLVLLEANPLDDIRNTRRIAAVVLRGTLYDRERLAAVLAAVESHPDRQTDDWGRTKGR